MTGGNTRVMVTTVPFGAVNREPIDLLVAAGIDLVLNPKQRRLRADEVSQVAIGFPVIIAGTETISAEAMAACHGLKAICRVGIGLDGIDLLAARRLGIAVAYTPDAPSPAVAELTIGLIIDLLRGIGPADRSLRRGEWTRVIGARVAVSTIGVIGVGRIGGRVIRHLQGGFPGVRILAHDLVRDPAVTGVEWLDAEAIYREADVVSVHVPLSAATHNLIGERELAMMKPTAALVNTARGGIVDEDALARALQGGGIRSAALDVFTNEPYGGPLAQLPNVLLTCHMGSMTADCRARMEIEATQDAIRFLSGQPLRSPVPAEEYANAECFRRH
jgi:D-3-phosphoglycerate dehydrogenase